MRKLNEKLTKAMDENKRPENAKTNTKNRADVNDDDDDLVQCKTLHAMKSLGSDRITPQAQPVQRKPLIKCDECKFEFISEDILNKHKVQFHKMKNLNRDSSNYAAQQSIEKGPPQSIPIVTNQRPTGLNIRRQYNCHECDYQGHRSKALYKHSVEAKHSKIDSLSETCYTCKQTFDNFMVLMKHRKEAHYDTISECHGFKAGDCKFGDRCYYRHSVASAGVTSRPAQTNNNGSHSENKSNDSFQEDLQIPPDLKELTVGFQKLMSQFLFNRERTENRQRGF